MQENWVNYLVFLPITRMQRAIPPMMISGSPAEAGVVGVVQTTPHPPGQPSAAGGQVRLPPAGQGGGVHTMAGVVQTIPHPPGQPLPAGGQESVPPAGQGGGVHTTVGVVQTIPHPPGQPFAAGGQEKVPPVGHTGGVQTTETEGAGDVAAITAETGTFTINRRMKKRTRKYLLSIWAIVRDFIKEIWLPLPGIPGISWMFRSQDVFCRKATISPISGTECTG
jgi:hypothetical protein